MVLWYFLKIKVHTKNGTSDSNTKKHGIAIGSIIFFFKCVVFGVTRRAANTEHNIYL
jgi:hypothetical protein